MAEWIADLRVANRQPATSDLSAALIDGFSLLSLPGFVASHIVRVKSICISSISQLYFYQKRFAFTLSPSHNTPSDTQGALQTMIPTTTLSIQAKTSHTKMPEDRNAGMPEGQNSPHATVSPQKLPDTKKVTFTHLSLSH